MNENRSIRIPLTGLAIAVTALVLPSVALADGGHWTQSRDGSWTSRNVSFGLSEDQSSLLHYAIGGHAVLDNVDLYVPKLTAFDHGDMIDLTPTQNSDVRVVVHDNPEGVLDISCGTPGCGVTIPAGHRLIVVQNSPHHSLVEVRGGSSAETPTLWIQSTHAIEITGDLSITFTGNLKCETRPPNE